VDTFKKFNGNSGTFNRSQAAVFQDNVQSYSTTEPGIDLTSTSVMEIGKTPSILAIHLFIFTSTRSRP